jgi:hypothetical protein
MVQVEGSTVVLIVRMLQRSYIAATTEATTTEAATTEATTTTTVTIARDVLGS